MPVVLDNNFSKDTYGMRVERLIAIQGNFPMIQPSLQAPSDLEDWAEDCYDVYAELLAKSGLEQSESETATAVVEEKVEALKEAYQNIRFIGTSIYTDNESIQNEYGFKNAFPQSRDDMFKRVDALVLAYNVHVGEGLTPLIPEVLITRLATAAEELELALASQDKERFDARRAVTELSERFVADTKKLNELKSWSYVMLGKQSDSLTLIGMVNPKTGGGGGSDTPVPSAPTNLIYLPADPGFSWNVVEGATSYEFQHKKPLDADWDVIYSGQDTMLYHSDSPGEYHARVRARNDGGFGEFSEVLVYTAAGGSD